MPDFTQDFLAAGSEDPFVSDFLGPEPTQAPPLAAATPPSSALPPGYRWGASQELANALMLGGGVPLAAGIMSATGAAPSYEAARSELQARRAQYERERPFRSLGLEVGGATLPTLGAMALGQEYAVAPMAARLAAAAPRAAPLISFLGGQAPAGAGAVARTAAPIVANVLAGGEAGALTHGLAPEGESMGRDVLLGGATGPLGLALGAAAPRVGQSVMDSAQRFMDLGVDLKLPQLGRGTPTITKPFRGTTDEQLGQFTKAGAKDIGLDQDTLSNEDLFGSEVKGTSGAAGRVGKEMESIAGKYNMRWNDPQLYSDFDRIKGEVRVDPAVTDSEREHVLSTMERVGAYPYLLGSDYANLTKYKSDLWRDIAGGNERLSHYAGDIKEALDDAWSRVLPSNDLARWNQLKYQYKSIMSMKPALNETTQQLDPNKLFTAVMRRNKQTTDPSVAGNMGTLAEGGKRFLAPYMRGGFLSEHPIGAVGAGLAGLWSIGEYGRPLMSTAEAHPIASSLSALLGAGAGAAGYTLSRPWATRILARPTAQQLLGQAPSPLAPGLALGGRFLYRGGAQ